MEERYLTDSMIAWVNWNHQTCPQYISHPRTKALSLIMRIFSRLQAKVWKYHKYHHLKLLKFFLECMPMFVIFSVSHQTLSFMLALLVFNTFGSSWIFSLAMSIFAPSRHSTLFLPAYYLKVMARTPPLIAAGGPVVLAQYLSRPWTHTSGNSMAQDGLQNKLKLNSKAMAAVIYWLPFYWVKRYSIHYILQKNSFTVYFWMQNQHMTKFSQNQL